MGGRGSSTPTRSASTAPRKTTSKLSILPTNKLKSISDSALKKHLTAITKEYYKSGKSGISFGGRDIDSVVDSLMKQNRSRASMIKDYKAIKKKMGV